MKRQSGAEFSAVLAFCFLTLPQFNVEIVLARVKFEHVFDQNEILFNRKELKLKQILLLLVVRQSCLAINEKLKMKSECIKADENQNI
ncbi:hypothetical protein T07_9130 [Trichinella nelsoni]|uniref:Secreted protein n=1 Tax=Trichinella nelsoni TaxID=6336 RepID=A0A0V0RW08_9BILA|nr:hypothetical protein T07_9130 [Trichinella nelsoni]